MSNIDMQAVLDAVNTIRHDKLGAEPISEIPKGMRGSAHGCPIANAISTEHTGAGVTPGFIRIWIEPENYKIAIPDVLVRFIEAFDDGAFPELVA